MANVRNRPVSCCPDHSQSSRVYADDVHQGSSGTLPLAPTCAPLRKYEQAAPARFFYAGFGNRRRSYSTKTPCAHSNSTALKTRRPMPAWIVVALAT